MGRPWSHSRDVVLMFCCIQYIPFSMAIMRHHTFQYVLWSQPSTPSEMYYNVPWSPDQLLWVTTLKQTKKRDKTNNWSPSVHVHQITWGSENFNLAILKAFCTQTCVSPWTFRSFSKTNSIHYDPYKLSIVQELLERDFNSWRNANKRLLHTFAVSLWTLQMISRLFRLN